MRQQVPPQDEGVRPGISKPQKARGHLPPYVRAWKACPGRRIGPSLALLAPRPPPPVTGSRLHSQISAKSAPDRPPRGRGPRQGAISAPGAVLGRRAERTDTPGRHRHAAGPGRQQRPEGSGGTLRGTSGKLGSPGPDAHPKHRFPAASPDPSPACSGSGQEPAASPHHHHLPAQRQPRGISHHWRLYPRAQFSASS